MGAILIQTTIPQQGHLFPSKVATLLCPPDGVCFDSVSSELAEKQEKLSPDHTRYFNVPLTMGTQLLELKCASAVGAQVSYLLPHMMLNIPSQMRSLSTSKHGELPGELT